MLIRRLVRSVFFLGRVVFVWKEYLCVRLSLEVCVLDSNFRRVGLDRV